MKRCSCAALAALLLLALSGCGASQDEGFVILASFYPVYVAALNVALDVPDAQVQCLAPPSLGCMHDYQLTGEDRLRIEEADIILLNGAGMEGFLDKALEGKTLADTSEGFPLLPAMDGGGVNEHVWLSLDGAIHQAERIRDALMQADPKNADLYAINAQNYIDQLMDLQANMHAALSPYKGAVIAAQHDSLAYFAQEFGLEIAAVLKAEPDSQLSAAELSAAAEAVRERGAAAIFAEAQYDTAAADALSRETGVPVYALDTAVTGELDDPAAYLAAMDYNTAVLCIALETSP